MAGTVVLITIKPRSTFEHIRQPYLSYLIPFLPRTKYPVLQQAPQDYQ